MSERIGSLRERLTLQSALSAAIGVTSLTSAGTLATAVTAVPHGFPGGDYAMVAGATPGGYNGRIKATVIGLSSFTYPVVSGLATPATGAITVLYLSDVEGGRATGWTTVDTVSAEVLPLSSLEQLQLGAVQGTAIYRFRVRVRSDLRLTMRVLWTPLWPPDAAPKTLQVTSILPEADGRFYQILNATEQAA
jgi:head-tail adaptor